MDNCKHMKITNVSKILIVGGLCWCSFEVGYWQMKKSPVDSPKNVVKIVDTVVVVEPTVQPIPKYQASAKRVNSTANDLCIIGKTYTLYSSLGHPDGNPFDPQTIATVIIVNKKNGYVQYCWANEYKDSNRTLFSRSCEDFVSYLK